MSQYNLQKTLLGCRLFFVEEGKVIDGVTVSKTAVPDVDPEDNWASLGCADRLQPYRKTEQDNSFKCFNGTRYEETTTEIVTEDGWDFTLEAHSEPLYRMMLGLVDEIQDGVPVRAYQNNIREVRGYLKFQARNVNANADVIVMNIWGKLTMVELPEYSDKSVYPRLRFTVESSDNNIVDPSNIENIS